MYRLFRKPLFSFFLFILIMFLLNFFLLPLLDNVSVFNGFMTIYLFWFFIIIFLFLISRSIFPNSDTRDKDV